MWGQRGGGRRADRRAFRPALDGRLEGRALLAAGIGPGVKTAFYGRSVIITDVDHERYRITVSDPGLRSNGATVRAVPRRNGRFDLFVYSSTPNTELVVDPVGHINRRNKQGEFPIGTAAHDGLLHIRDLTVKTGRIGQILGFRTTDLSGTLAAEGTTAVDRIALFRVLPGATIRTGGDLNTLNVFNSATFSRGGALQVGRDLNWFSIGGDLTVGDNGQFRVGRDIGQTAQGAKGTDPGGQGGRIQGDLDRVGVNEFAVGRDIVAPVRVVGNILSNGQVVQLGPINLA